MNDDRIPDPRDDQAHSDPTHSDEHPGSLAAFEDWCRQVGARLALIAITQYRRAVANSRKERKDG